MDLDMFLGAPVVDNGKEGPEWSKFEYEAVSEVLCKALDYGEHPPYEGLYLEFGVWQGRSINHFSENLTHKHWWGFDSFHGLPEEFIHGTKPAPAGFFSLDGKFPKVNDNVTLVQGWFNETLPVFLESHSGHVNFVNIDSDLYSSAKYILETLNDRIVKNTMIRFDDFIDWRDATGECDDRKPQMLYTNWRNGEFKAFNEWVETYNRKFDIVFRTWNKSILIKITQ